MKYWISNAITNFFQNNFCNKRFSCLISFFTRKKNSLYRKNKFLNQNFVKCYAMCLFSKTLTTRGLLGTQILPKKNKNENKLCKINAYGFVLQSVEFRSINRLPTKERVHQCINAIILKFFNNNSPLNSLCNVE